MGRHYSAGQKVESAASANPLEPSGLTREETTPDRLANAERISHSGHTGNRFEAVRNEKACSL